MGLVSANLLFSALGLAMGAWFLRARFLRMRDRHGAERSLNGQAPGVGEHAVDARIDSLTQLSNYAAFHEELSQSLNERERDRMAFTLLMVGVNCSKILQGVEGHRAGDAVLRDAAALLRQRLRATDVAARYGEEQFAVILRGTPTAGAEAVAESIRVSIQDACLSATGANPCVTADIGLSHALPGDTVSAVVGRADAALDAARKRGSNCVFRHDGQAIRLLLPGQESRSPDSDPDGPRSVFPELGECSTLANDRQPHLHPARAQYRRGAGRPLASRDLTPGDPVVPCGRKTFLLVVEHRLAELRRNGIQWSIVLARLENHQRICDRHGPHAGSLALQAVAKSFLADVREMDWVARFDSTTFAILLPGANLRNGQGVADRLRLGVASASLSVDGSPLEVSIVVGTTEATRDDDSDTLLRRVEMTLDDSFELCHAH